MNFNPVLVLTLCLIKLTVAVRLHKLFQFIDGFRSEHNLLGFLHIGNEYTVLLRAPKPHDKLLQYELYEAKNVPDIGTYKPQLLVISEIPVNYIKEQLKIYRAELYKAKYVDGNVVPGTQVRSLGEWQIQEALRTNEANVLRNRVPVKRTLRN